ncbi:ATP synthase F1 subunit delta [Legionella quinlivanii]|uniref:ATP synthase subunit delta n=1 Tax=Legionella quinlivanii TaxID=45073 RepID=A0A0W0Y5U0_9GAMM|nr:F0F1 ATP synthase subunit delta [Legionella quinlivanii]KTD52004.1 ATP synthase F1 subunit delta [Legionella quinlivanii]MCW8452267.1 F0F1 ATP synthase subunit delta [Legionella quinlivanii]SEF87289.1 F-type H+-transporting ATPase subunit delta [Legionella quinlivanii DSM 21216]STY12501.1 ATP synthase F1 subunit delta [Legionella quinlivanii]
MPDTVTLARPYAKAIFEHALNEKKLAVWSEYLNLLALLVMNEQSERFINNPATTAAQHSEFLSSLLPSNAGADADALNNLIALLSENRRLMLLPDIMVLFEAERAEHEKTLEVEVFSYSELSDTQQDKLAKALSERLQRKVKLNIVIDKSLIGGAIINAGDLVIDGSVSGRLTTLRTSLAA